MTRPVEWGSSAAYCRRVVRRAHSSFPLAFRVLPPAKRDAMAALYAYFRLTDDLADGSDDPSAKRAALTDWRSRLRAALAGKYSHRCHAALHRAADAFDIPGEELEGAIDGAERDLGPGHFATFADLYPYCFQVASTVGMACVRVWGVTDPSARGAALDLAGPAGAAFQLTNVLRDLGEDLARGRVYLPQDELARFGCPPETWRDRTPAFRTMMRFQADRARDYYRRAEALPNLLSADGRAVFRVMAGVYRRLLDEIERRDFDVFTDRVRVGKWAKAKLLASAWPTKWGWI